MNDEFISYQEILRMEPTTLAAYLEQKKLPVDISLSCPQDAELASNLLRAIANNCSFLTSLASFAVADKRKQARIGRTQGYEDAIDREAIIERALKGCDTQYKALSKSISLYMNELNEKNYSKAG